MDLQPGWREVTWLEFLAWSKRKTAIDENGSDTVRLHFSDGSEAIIESSWRGPYSEVTPDIDPNPPTVFVKDAV